MYKVQSKSGHGQNWKSYSRKFKTAAAAKKYMLSRPEYEYGWFRVKSA